MNSTKGCVLVLSFLALSIPSLVFAGGERVLIFKDSLAYSGHQAAIAACLSLIRGWANDSGFSVDTTIHLTDFNTANLAAYKAVIALYPYRQDPANSNAWYDDTMSGPEDSAFKAFLLSGKGYLSVHCGSRLNNNWPWFMDSAIGVQYTADQGPVSCTFHVADTTQIMTRGIPETFTGDQQVRGDNIFFSDTDKSYTLLILSDSNDYVKENVARQKLIPMSLCIIFMEHAFGKGIWAMPLQHGRDQRKTPSGVNCYSEVYYTQSIGRAMARQTPRLSLHLPMVHRILRHHPPLVGMPVPATPPIGYKFHLTVILQVPFSIRAG